MPPDRTAVARPGRSRCDAAARLCGADDLPPLVTDTALPPTAGSLGRNSFWYLSEKFVRLGGMFLVSIWVARYLGPHDYGTLAFGIALMALAAFLVSLGVESLVVRDLAQDPGRASEILSTYFGLRLAGAVIGPLAACAYVWLTDTANDSLLAVTAVLGVGVFLTVLDLADPALQARHQARLTSAVRAGAFIGASLAKCALILSGASLVWFAVATIVENLLTCLIYAVILHGLGIRLSWRCFDRGEMRTFIVDGRYMVLSGLAVAIYSRIDIIVIASVISETVLANYALAAAMVGAWNLLGTSFAQAVAPHIANAHARSFDEYVGVLRRFLLAALTISVAGSAMISLLAGSIFRVLLGDSYMLGGEILRILIWSSVPAFLGVATSQIIVNERIYGTSLLRTLLGMALMLLLVYPVAISFGAVGVAWLVVASNALATGALLFSKPARRVLASIITRSSQEGS
jgi:O-antigen/teichoic acid export membrane protein